MNVDALAQAAYIVAALLFILSLAGLSKHETSRMGSAFGIIGMALALAATIWYTLSGSTLAVAGLIAVAVLLGAIIGLLKARSVQMTELPELIAALHSLVGLAAVLVGWNGYLQYKDIRASLGQMAGVHDAEILIGVFIGAVTFTGSIVAYLKLSGKIKSAPLMLPGKDFLNLGALAAFIGLTIAFVLTQNLWLLVAATVIALALGWHLVAAIGGGDMPVVVSMLNSYSGWAAAASGFLLNNNLLIITGALPGQEQGYPEPVERYGLGIVSKGVKKLPAAVKSLLADDGRELARIRECQQKYRRFDNARRIAEAARDLALGRR